MKESQLYLQFIKTFGLLFVLFAIIGLIVAVYFLKQLPTLYTSERMYEFAYTLNNAAAVEKESEQVVATLRSPQLKEKLGIKSSQVNIYKPGPFSIILQVKNEDPEISVNNLTTLSGYLTGNYQVKQIGKEIFIIEPKPYFKYLIFGFITAEIAALILSLLISYLKKY